MEMERYLVVVNSGLEYFTTSYILEVVSMYGVYAHLFALAAMYEAQEMQIDDEIQKKNVLRIIGKNKNITYTVTKI